MNPSSLPRHFKTLSASSSSSWFRHKLCSKKKVKQQNAKPPHSSSSLSHPNYPIPKAASHWDPIWYQSLLVNLLRLWKLHQGRIVDWVHIDGRMVERNRRWWLCRLIYDEDYFSTFVTLTRISIEFELECTWKRISVCVGDWAKENEELTCQKLHLW